MRLNCTYQKFRSNQKVSKLFTIGSYAVYAGISFYGGKNYEYILFSNKEDITLDRVSLFSIFDGCELVFRSHSNSMLIIPQKIINTSLMMLSSVNTPEHNVWDACLACINKLKEPVSLDTPIINSFTYDKSTLKKNVDLIIHNKLILEDM